MAQVARFINNDPISNGTTSANLSTEDKMPLQHTTGDNADKYATLSQIQAVPVGTTASSSTTQTKTVVLQNYPADYKPIVGSEVVVIFTNANTAAAQMKLKVGNITEVCTCRGVPMMSGSVRAGAVLRFVYTGSSFDCQFAEPLSAVNISSASPVNSSAVDELISFRPYTITFTGDGISATPEQSVYNVSVIRFGDVYLCTFNLLLGEIIEPRLAFLFISSLNSNNYRGEGMLNSSDGKSYALSSLGNKNVWVYENGERVRTNIFSAKRIKGYIIYYPFSAPSAQTLSVE